MPKLLPFAFLLLCTGELFGQTTPPAKAKYPFEVAVTGAGKSTILFLPGFACSGSVWDETLPTFTPKYSCHVFTMAGFAGATPHQEPVLTEWVEALAAYIKEKDLDRPIIVGHSLGGVMALLVAAKHPDLVSRIVIVDALPCLPALQNPAFIAKIDPHCEQAVERIRHTSDEQFLQMEKFVIPTMIADTIHRPAIIQWGLKSDRTTYASIYCQFNNTDLRETIGAIRCPTLVLLETPFASIKPAVESQYAKCSTAQLHYATKGLHFIMFDDREWFLKELNQFL